MIAKPDGASCCSYAGLSSLGSTTGGYDGGDVVRHSGASSADRGVDRGGRVGGVLRVDHDDQRAVGARPKFAAIRS